MDMKNIEEQLLSYFSGTADESTIEAVESWIAESDGNRKTADDVECICAVADSMRTIKSIDTEAALDKMHKRIHARRRNGILRCCARFAAMFLLPVLMVAGFYVYEHCQLDETEYIEVRATAGMIASVTLPDNSTVWLNSNSTLRYPARFTGRTRNVELDGEGYFKVSADKDHKFIVHTPGDMQVEVYGTEFNVDAYDVEGRDARTTLVSGKVQVRYDGPDDDSRVVDMKPGDMVSLNPESREVCMSDVNADVVSSWKDGKIILQNTTLEDALRMIENRYHVKFIIKNPDLLDNRYTGQFYGHRLDVVLEHFRRTTEIRFVRGEVLPEGMEVITIY